MNYKKFFKIVGTIVISFLIIASAILAGLYLINPDILKNNLLFDLSKMFPIKSQDKPVNILFLGLDKVSNNTDVIVVANLNPKTQKVNVLSIPRDTRVEYKGDSHKINSIYHIGKRNDKEDLPKEIIGEIIGQKIDYMVVANPEGFRNIIDILGGVEVNVPGNMNYDDNAQNLHIHLKKGLQLLDGSKAEQFVRYRHGYKDGDLGRIDAQHIFFKAFVEQKLKPQFILKTDQIINQVFQHVKTDIPIPVAIKYSLYAKDIKLESVMFHKLPGEPKRTHGAWYFIYSLDETQKLINENFVENYAKSN